MDNLYIHIVIYIYRRNIIYWASKTFHESILWVYHSEGKGYNRPGQPDAKARKAIRIWILNVDIFNHQERLWVKTLAP